MEKKYKYILCIGIQKVVLFVSMVHIPEIIAALSEKLKQIVNDVVIEDSSLLYVAPKQVEGNHWAIGRDSSGMYYLVEFTVVGLTITISRVLKSKEKPVIGGSHVTLQEMF